MSDRRSVLKHAFERLQTDLKYQAPELHGNVVMQCYQDVAAELNRLLQERDALKREIGEHAPRDGFGFSQRERARRAAMFAAARYDSEMEQRAARGEVRLDWWGWVVNAALEAAIGRHQWEPTGVAQAHCLRCGAHSPHKDERPEFGCAGVK